MRRLVLVAACVAFMPHVHAQVPSLAIPAFSSNQAGAALPAGWMAVLITERKKPTLYDLVDDHGVVVLHARAEAAASLLGHELHQDVAATPLVQWRWKTARLIPGADNTVRGREDAPVRVIFEFEGDRSKLSLGDQTAFRMSRIVTGRQLAYASLMYIWSNRVPVDTLFDDPFTSRIKIIVASSGPAHLNEWQVINRNLIDDFRHAFGEDPGTMVSVSVMTDTDNTGGSAESWYGDIAMRPARP